MQNIGLYDGLSHIGDNILYVANMFINFRELSSL